MSCLSREIVDLEHLELKKYTYIVSLVEDLVNQTEVEVAVLKHSPVHAQLQSSSDPMHRQVWNRVRQSRKER